MQVCACCRFGQYPWQSCLHLRKIRAYGAGPVGGWMQWWEKYWHVNCAVTTFMPLVKAVVKEGNGKCPQEKKKWVVFFQTGCTCSKTGLCTLLIYISVCRENRCFSEELFVLKTTINKVAMGILTVLVNHSFSRTSGTAQPRRLQTADTAWHGGMVSA